MRKGNIIAKQSAGNKVDCYIYAVEKSLDSDKFNLLQNLSLIHIFRKLLNEFRAEFLPNNALKRK